MFQDYRQGSSCCFALLLASPGGLQAKATDADTLRVLAIGNSFSQDAVEQYLHELGSPKVIS